METKAWNTKKPGKYPPGPWDQEHDKVQFPDPATGLPCLVVRGPMGAWCGYVGVGPTHPWYGRSYNGCALETPCEDSYCDHSPASQLSVHGGITFSDECSDASREAFGEFLDYYAKNQERHEAEAAKHPQGDSARWLEEWAPLRASYEAWKAHKESTSICHIPGPGDFEPAWWFGFDCSHAGDLTPVTLRYRERYKAEGLFLGEPGETYKDMHYAMEQCYELAGQLWAVGQK